ncbi:MAG: phosphatase PAP2 family protein [Anaerolineae bacterium]|nr:phosphatase PAP2 family protein [Anaerolineae bacterium]
MKPIIAWLVKIDNLAYSLYIEEISKGNFKNLRKFSSWIGLPIPLFTMIILIGGLCTFFIGSRAYLIVTIAYLTSSIINLFIKAAYKRTRPPNNNFWSPIPFDKYSFPSGHAAGTMSVAICLGHFAPDLAAALTLWSLFIGVSRFFGDFHHPTDVLSGFIVGVFSGYIVIGFIQKIYVF